MRTAIKHLITRLVELRDRFDVEKSRAQLLGVQLVECRSRLVRMKEEIDELTAGIDALDKVR
jgi:hypothetical protein